MNYDLSTIRNAFRTLLQFKRDYAYNSLVGNLDDDLIGIPESGLYYNSGVNPLITLKNIEALMPLASEMEVDAWSNSTTYAIDDAVLVSDVYYRSVVDANLNHLVSDTNYWAVTTLMSIWVRHVIWGTFDTVLSRAIKTDDLIEYIRMYQNATSDDTTSNESNYVGFEIRPKNAEHLRAILTRIGTQFSETQAALNIYLYKQNTLVKTFALSSLVANEFVFTDITDYEIYGEGRWFLFYNQDDLTGEAYNWNTNNDYHYVDILPFEVANTTTDFVNNVSAYTHNGYGLGLELSIDAQLTNFITDNKRIFAKAIHLQWQHDILELFLTNPEVQVNAGQRNINRQETRDILLGELKSETRYSLISILDRTYRSLIKSLDQQEVTLPGTNESLINYKSYG